MKNFKYIFSLVILLIICSCQEENKKEDLSIASSEIGLIKNDDFSNKEIEQVWNHFLKTLEKGELKELKASSHKKIRCYYCLENTSAERKELDIFREKDSLWYDKIYDDLIYISINDFIEDDYDLIFTPEFIKILKEKETSFHKNTIEGVEYYEVLVTTTDPTPTHEGGQHSFQFKKDNGKWKFNGIGTIP